MDWSAASLAWTCLLATCIYLAWIPLRGLQRKLRIARGLAPIPGPKGVPLLGLMPKFIKNKNRIYDFLVRVYTNHYHP